jgi:hypothetical protein
VEVFEVGKVEVRILWTIGMEGLGLFGFVAVEEEGLDRPLVGFRGEVSGLVEGGGVQGEQETSPDFTPRTEEGVFRPII